MLAVGTAVGVGGGGAAQQHVNKRTRQLNKKEILFTVVVLDKKWLDKFTWPGSSNHTRDGLVFSFQCYVEVWYNIQVIEYKMRNSINESYKKSTRLLKAMAHPVRLAILDILLDHEEECVCHLEAMLGYRQAYLSQHLMSMREAGLVEDRRDGRNIFYRISEPGMVSLISNMRLLLEPQREVTLANPAECACPKCVRGERTAAAEEA